MRTILLFDMDNVLLRPGGYRRALQDTVAALAASLGYRPPTLGRKEIEEIEAHGVTSEWEMAAIIGAILLVDSALGGDPQPLPTELKLGPHEGGRVPPEIMATFRQLPPRTPERSLAQGAQAALLKGSPPVGAQTAASVRRLLEGARTPETVTYRTIQELVLGSETYDRIYGLAPVLGVESYLEQHDRSHLTGEARARLTSWLAQPDHSAIIFTNRPNRPPAGHEDSPEAEIGAGLVGLDNLPIVGSGDMGWLSRREGKPPDHYLKPSAVHGLTSLQVGLGSNKERSLLAAAEISRDGYVDPSDWEALAGAKVIVFEDSALGMKSLLTARSQIREAGVDFSLELKGVAENRAKRRALRSVNAMVHPTLASALGEVLSEDLPTL